MTAYEIQANIKAGLQLVGYSNGEYQWMGTEEEWGIAEALKYRE